MSYRFFDDFTFSDESGKPYNILIERNSDFQHGHSTVKDNAYHILIPGNKHLAQTPPLKNFKTRLKLKIDTPLFEDSNDWLTYGFRVFFRYDRFLKEGYLLECAISDKAFSANLFALNRRNEKTVIKATETPVPAKFNRSVLSFLMEVKENRVAIGLNGIRVEITDGNNTFPRAGQIGLDKCFYHGELIVEEWSISSAEKVGKSRIAGPLTLELPCVHGMSVPYQYTLNMFKYENGPYALDIKLSGGIKDRPDRGKCGNQWCHEIDMMKTPYVRVDSPRGEVKNIILYNGLMTLLDKEEQRVWMLNRYEKIEWPLKRQIYLDALPDIGEITFAAGYEYFDNDPQGILAGGPFEVVADSCGNMLYHGQALRRGNVALSVKSLENKLICSRIPANIPDREKALVHARENGYFYEKEKIIFNLKIHYHSDLFFAEEFKLSAQVQSVYGDGLGNEVRLSVTGNAGARADLLKDKLGINCLCYQAEIDGPLDTGVYHLAVKLRMGNKPIYDDTIIFEVISSLPGAVPPPIASGLPFLYSNPSEIKYVETNAFDPKSKTAGAMHYFSACCFYPEYAREKRIWELIKFYNRKWFLIIMARTSSRDLSIEGNKDIIEQCDFLEINLENDPRHNRYDLWKADIYKGEVVDILIDFFRLKPEKLKCLHIISMKLLEEVKAKKECLPEKAFIELVDNCWQAWLEYFSVRLADILKKQHDQLKAVNNKTRRSFGGPFSVYLAHNKSAYFMNYWGYNKRGGAAKYIAGFWQYEDYPHSCGYSITKGVLGLMTVKLHYDAARVFPEIYDTRLLDGCNDGAVAQAHPPFGFYDLPAALIRLPVYEYAFAAIWFKENKFHFWNDYGFHFRAPQKKCIKELISAWGNVVKHKPARPVKTTCFLIDWDLIAKHPDYYEKNCNVHFTFKDVYNTAEEALAYAYSSARNAGIPAGFVTSLADLKDVSPDSTDLLVLPPLNNEMPAEHIETIRNLHRQGVSLLGFENVHGLEDLFGVKPLERAMEIRKIGVTPKYGACLGDLGDEYAEHELCKAWYKNEGAAVILAGAETVESTMDIPVLLANQTKWGQTAFFNIPPTVVKRDSFIERLGYGQECISAIIKKASDYIIRNLSKPWVSSQDAKVIAFYDEKGDLIVIIEEESLAIYSDAIKYPRSFLLNINIPGIKSGDLSCDRDYAVASEAPGNIVLRLYLGRFEAALFKLT